MTGENSWYSASYTIKVKTETENKKKAESNAHETDTSAAAFARLLLVALLFEEEGGCFTFECTHTCDVSDGKTRSRVNRKSGGADETPTPVCPGTTFFPDR